MPSKTQSQMKIKYLESDDSKPDIVDVNVDEDGNFFPVYESNEGNTDEWLTSRWELEWLEEQLIALENGDLDKEQQKLILKVIDTNRKNPLVLQLVNTFSDLILEIAMS